MVSRKLIETLFGGGRSQSMVAFPLRVVYMIQERTANEPPVQLLVSVPKKHFKHAVDRNRVKRQVREAFRLHKQTLHDALPPTSQLLLAFVWLSDSHSPSVTVERRVVGLMQRVAERVGSETSIAKRED
jgi:ribonuclease P protein component